MLDNQFDNFVIRRVACDLEIFEFALILAKDVERLQPTLLQQLPQLIFAQRGVIVVDLVVLDAIFPKQRRKIAARRSGRLFVNCDLFRHRKYYVPIVSP